MLISTVVRAPRTAAAVPGGSDEIAIDGLRLRCILGVGREERRERQVIVISMRIAMDARPAAINDNVGAVWNYRTFTKAVVAHVEGSACVTVERLAAEIARIGVVEHGAPRIEVSVHKPGALRFADDVSIRIRRDASDFPGGAASVSGAR